MPRSSSMHTHVLYVNVTDTVTLACEACHRSKTLPATAVKDLPQPLTVRCPCEALLVAFRLDDPQQSLIQTAVRVRRIADGGIGGEFLDHDAYTDTNRILGFYLRP